MNRRQVERVEITDEAGIDYTAEFAAIFDYGTVIRDVREGLVVDPDLGRVTAYDGALGLGLGTVKDVRGILEKWASHRESYTIAVTWNGLLGAYIMPYFDHEAEEVDYYEIHEERGLNGERVIPFASIIETLGLEYRVHWKKGRKS